jgi:hypothetical protein
MSLTIKRQRLARTENVRARDPSGSLPTATRSAGTIKAAPPWLHPHLHVVPRFDDEPMADHGVRSGIKDPANRRPDPWRPGIGRHVTGS